MFVKKEDYVHLFEEKENFRKKYEAVNVSYTDLKETFEQYQKQISKETATLNGDKQSLESDIRDYESRLYAANHTKELLQVQLSLANSRLKEIGEVIQMPLEELKKQHSEYEVTYDHVAKCWFFGIGTADSETDAYRQAVMLSIYNKGHERK